MGSNKGYYDLSTEPAKALIVALVIALVMRITNKKSNDIMLLLNKEVGYEKILSFRFCCVLSTGRV